MYQPSLGLRLVIRPEGNFMEEYLQKLANHANLYRGTESTLWKSLGASLWEAEQTGIFPDVIHHGEDILQCLEIVNIEINGPNAADRSSQASREIPRDLAIFVSELVALCYEYALDWEKNSLFTNNELFLLKQTIWMITQGWCRVVAGDFDNIPAEVRLDGELKEIL